MFWLAPTAVQVVGGVGDVDVEWYAVNVLPLRTTRTQTGAVPLAVVRAVVVDCPAVLRRCIWCPFALVGVVSIVMLAAPLAVPLRIITPALVHTFVLVIESTRAVM